MEGAAGQAAAGNAGQASAGGEGAAAATQAAATGGEANVATAEAGEQAATDLNVEKIVDKKDQKNLRTQFRERYKTDYPDMDTEDNDAFYKNANEHYEKRTKEITDLGDYKKKNVSINQKMMDTFNSQPELAAMIRDVMKGAPLNVAIARNIDIASLEPKAGDQDEAEWAKATAERLKRKTDQDAYIKGIDTNIEVSIKDIQAFAKENELDGTKVESFMQQVDELVSDVIQGKVTKKTLTNLFRAINADNEVAVATKKAVVDARNEKIDVKKQQDTAAGGDGMPHLTATTTEKPEVKKEEVDVWSQAAEHQAKKKRI